MLKAHIYGLPPGNKSNTSVIIFDEKTYNSKEAVKLGEGKPDHNGMFNCHLLKFYQGKDIRLVALPDEYIEINEPIHVSVLGAFHTVKLSKNDEYPVTHKWPVNPDAWYRISQEHMRRDYRNARHKNYLSKSIYWVLTIGSPVTGFFFAGTSGVTIGFAISLVTIFLDKYASGQERGI